MKATALLIAAFLGASMATYASTMSGPGWKLVSFTTEEDQTVTLRLRQAATFDAKVSTLEVLIDTGDCHVEETIDVSGFADLSQVGFSNDTTREGEKYYTLYIGAIEVDPHNDQVQHHLRRHFDIRKCFLKPTYSVSMDEPS